MKKILPIMLMLIMAVTVALPTSAKASDLTITKATVATVAGPRPNTTVEEYVDTTTVPDAEGKYYVSVKDCYWSTDLKSEMYRTNTFTAGSTYYYSIVLKTTGGYVFSGSPTLTIKGAVVDSDMQIIIGDGGQKATFQNAFKVVCGTGQTQTIANLTLSKTTFYYNGKVQKPNSEQIMVVDTNGASISSDNYSVDYSAGKKPGTYTVKVTGKNLATGEASATYTINPSPPRSVRVSGGSGSVKVKWSKPKSGKPDYYDVLVYKDSACKDLFSSARLAKTSKTIVGLKSGMTYYVKVDCFVNSDSGYLVSKPTSAKAVTVK